MPMDVAKAIVADAHRTWPFKRLKPIPKLDFFAMRPNQIERGSSRNRISL
jgi:hypothetical protein